MILEPIALIYIAFASLVNPGSPYVHCIHHVYACTVHLTYRSTMRIKQQKMCV